MRSTPHLPTEAKPASPHVRGAREELTEHPHWTRRVAWHVIGAAFAALAGLLLFAKVGEDVFEHESGSFDGAIQGWMLGHRTPALFDLFTWVTNAGSSAPTLVMTALTCVWLWRVKHRHAAAGAIAAPVVGVALFNAIKTVYGRPRPTGAAHFHLATYAFPSGHATVAMAAAVTVAYVLWREGLLARRWAILLGTLVPLLVGFSRSYLDVHWATDVLGGWCVGFFVAGLAGVAYERLRRDPDIARADHQPDIPPPSRAASHPPTPEPPMPPRSAHSAKAPRSLLALLALLSLGAGALGAQRADPRDDTRTDTLHDGGDRRFIRPHDLAMLGAGIAASAALSVFDTRIARWDQSAGVQGSSGRRRVVNDITHVNETTLTVAGVVAYGVGRVVHADAFTDIAKHTTESVVLSSLISQALRGPLGRTRPYVTHDSDQYDFHALEGFRRFDNRAWPSLHSATAFAAGSALVGEVRERHPDALRWAAPLIYTAAALPGLSRMYLDQHWASDVLAGDVIGAVIGARLVHYAHTARPGAGPRWLVDTTVRPSPAGGLMVGLTLTH